MTCTSAGNPYPSGIRYTTPTAQPGANIDDPATLVLDLEVRLDPGTAVTLAPDATVAGAVELSGRQGAGVMLDADRNTSIATSGGQFGVAARTDAGPIRIISGTIATTGQSGGGIATNSQGGGATTIDAGPISTTGDNADAIQARSLRGGDVSIAAESIFTAGAGSNGIRLFGADLARFVVRVTGPITTTGDGANGVLGTLGSASLDLGIATVTTSGANADGVLMDNTSASVTASVGRANTSGTGANAVFLRTQGSGIIQLSAGDVTTTGEGASAIQASAVNGNILVNTSGTVSTAGTGTVAIGGSSTTGSVSIIAGGRVATTGLADAAGVQALVGDINGGGAATVRVTDVSTAGIRSRAVGAYGNSASATVTGAVSTAGASSTGVTVLGGNGGARFESAGTVITGGDDSWGVDIRAPGAVTVAGTGSITTSGARSTGLFVESNSDVAVNQGAITTSGVDARAAALTTSAANLDFSFDRLSTQGGNASGVYARTGTGGTLRGTVGSVTTFGLSSRGIDLTGGGGLVLRAGSVSTRGDGTEAVFAFMAGNSSITVDNATTSGAGARGVAAASVLGNMTVSLANGSTTGTGATLVDISAPQGSTGLSSTGTLSVSGPGSALAVVRGGVNATATIANARIAGAESAGLRVEAGNIGTAIITGTVTDNADASGFTQVVAVSGQQTVVTNNGSIVATGTNTAGILATAPSSVTIGGTGSVSTVGNGGYGIQAAAVAGPASVTQGSVSTSGNDATGVIARSNDTVSVGVGTVSTAGNNATGILVEGRRAGVANAGTVTTRGAGASTGILVNVSGAATVTAGNVSVQSGTVNAILARGATGTVSTTGQVTAAGAGSAAAVQLSAGTGPATASVGSINASGTGRTALFLESVTTASATVLSGATVTGNTDAILLAGRTGNSLVNSGTVNAGSGAALRVVGGTASIDNRGTITGPLVLTDGNDVLTNSGQLISGAGTSLGAGNDVLTNTGTVSLSGSLDFGAGVDLFTNAGTLRLVAATSPRTVALTGLEQLNNSGTIALADGVAGDVLTVPGGYAGSGTALLTLDVRNGAVPMADQLVIGGGATGSTRVSVAFAGGMSPLGGRVTLVQGGAGTTANAFVLGDDSRQRGLVSYGLLFDTGSNRFDLVAAPSATALRVAKLAEGIRSLSYAASDAVSDQLRAGRDAADQGVAAGEGRLWGQIFSRVIDRKESRAVSVAGFSQTVRDDYRQDNFGAQLGIGLVSSGVLTAGLTGGYQNATLRFRGVGERFTIDALNIGGYAGVRSGAAFLNVIGRYERFSGRYRVPALGIAQPLDADGLGARTEAGVRLGGQAFFVEPRVGVTYARAGIDQFTAGGLGFDLNDRDGLRGDAGARLGASIPLSGGSVVTVYGGGDVVHEFRARDQLQVSGGGATLTCGNDRIGTYGRGQLGVTISSGRVTGFIQAEGAAGTRYRTGGGRAGLRVAL